MSCVTPGQPGTIYCPGCARELAPRQTDHRCPGCNGPLSWRPAVPPRFPREELARRPTGIWRYAEALPALPMQVSLGELPTPLVPFDLDGIEVLAKCEFCLPTGSYKDRGAALLISQFRAVGVVEAVEDSSGNAGAALAAYAGRAGIRLTVFCPASAPAAKLVQVRQYGAGLVRVEGPRPRATEALLEHVRRTGATYASHLWQPLFLHGVKTMAFELWEQLGGQAPEVVVCPVGAGSILLGLYYGFSELLQAGAIAALPKLVAVQAERVSPVCTAMQTKADRVTPAAAGASTLADGIALPGPVRDRELLHALREASGTAVAVTEDEIADGVRRLGRAGFCVEPTSATIWPGLQRLRDQGRLRPGTTVVAILSGHGLKAGAAIAPLLD
ncbi:MAG: pyridoxal-phosphate dependent enzyme [Candidatus Latescibacterota bacterium]